MWIKICGLTEASAIDAALQGGADAVGFVFAPSVRRIEPGRAALLATAARGRAALIAVTLHPTQQQVDEIISVVKPDMLQADLADFDRLTLPGSLARLPVVRGSGSGSGSGGGDRSRYPERLLFEGARSGSGEVSDWQAAIEWARTRELILAGGLHAGNIADAIATVRPFGVDVSSGVEDAPGRKHPEKIAQFIAKARDAFRRESDGNRSVG
ncbi:MAG TPA: phosphoribosylanthranilate isomerase [Steroidobacteraceae bacterium]|jgi:phosphoribosylanthranilate isomerase|nr:phosphoribosylanthranilate isomerase [Steroidobacteraceae bacterium]